MIYRIKTIDEFDENSLIRTYTLLNEKQKEHADIKPFDKRMQSLCVRALLAEMLGEEIIPFIKFAENGQLLNLPDGRYISFSHSGKFVAAACSECPVGIDIQILKPISDKIIERICTCEEFDYVQNNGAASFFDIWTIKEAFVKCFGISFAKGKSRSFVKNGKLHIENCELVRISNDEYCCCVLTSKL